MSKLFVSTVGLLLWVFMGLSLASGPVTAAFDPLAKACDKVGASSDTCQEADKGGTDPLTGNDGILTKATNIISVVVGLASVIVIVIAGLTMTLSGGDASKVQSSRNAIIYAAVGLAVAALARMIVIFITSSVQEGI